MFNTAVDLAFAHLMICLGVGLGWWLCSRIGKSLGAAANRRELMWLRDATSRLEELTVNLTTDVGEHNTRITEINGELSAADVVGQQELIKHVTSLVEANERLQQRLAESEAKLQEQSRLIEVHAAEARSDALTGLANRHALDDKLDRRFAELQCDGRPFSILIVDIDRFKPFNDQHGPLAGDAVLRQLAQLLRRTVREVDFVARYGGGQFGIVLPNTLIDDAIEAAERCRRTIARFRFQHQARQWSVTVSIGVAQSLPSEGAYSLMRRVAEALGESKRNGRNRTCWHDGWTIRRAGLAEQTIVAEKDKQLEPQQQEQKKEEPTAKPEQKTEPDERRRRSDPADQPPPSPPPSEARDNSLSNRTSFCRRVRERIDDWDRGGPFFSLVFAEVDRFDRLTRSHGQNTAEQLLCTVAQYIKASIDEDAMTARYGPCCIGILLSETELDDAARTAERLREQIAQYPFPVRDGEIRPSLSLGVTQVIDGDDWLHLLRRAEAAVSAAQRSGGNAAYLDSGRGAEPAEAADPEESPLSS